MDSAARDAANTYFELRDRGEEDWPAFQAALRVYRGHHPGTTDDAARQVVSLIIAETIGERGRRH